MTDINPEYLKPGNEHFLYLAYVGSYEYWLRKYGLPKNEETWKRFKACSYGRFAE
jgi:hypothetical protein